MKKKDNEIEKKTKKQSSNAWEQSRRYRQSIQLHDRSPQNACWSEYTFHTPNPKYRKWAVKHTCVQSLVLHIVGQVPRLQLRWRFGRLLPPHRTAATDRLDERSTHDTLRYWTPSPHDLEHCAAANSNITPTCLPFRNLSVTNKQHVTHHTPNDTMSEKNVLKIVKYPALIYRMKTNREVTNKKVN